MVDIAKHCKMHGAAGTAPFDSCVMMATICTAHDEAHLPSLKIEQPDASTTTAAGMSACLDAAKQLPHGAYTAEQLQRYKQLAAACDRQTGPRFLLYRQSGQAFASFPTKAQCTIGAAYLAVHERPQVVVPPSPPLTPAKKPEPVAETCEAPLCIVKNFAELKWRALEIGGEKKKGLVLWVNAGDRRYGIAVTLHYRVEVRGTNAYHITSWVKNSEGKSIGGQNQIDVADLQKLALLFRFKDPAQPGALESITLQPR